MSDIGAIKKNYLSLEERISSAVKRSGRERKDVQLLAVSKKQPVEKMLALQEACLQHKAKAVFGENYVQEFKQKKEKLSGAYSSHFIGSLQRNKARDAVKCFDVIESIDSLRLLEAVEREAGHLKKKQRILLQVNISQDPSKGGFQKSEVLDLFKAKLGQFENLLVEGLMTITEYYEDPLEARGDFRKMKELRDEVMNATNTRQLKLSMGMSRDFEVAIEEGANIVRVGTALFGARSLSRE